MTKNVWQRGSQLIIFVTLLCLTGPAFSAERPDAGTTISGLGEHKLVPVEQSVPRIEVDSKQQTSVPATGGPQIMVGGIHITGQNIYSEDKLLSLISDALGKQLTLGQLETLAGRISKYFHAQGYFLANAVIPAQDIKGGVVEIAVVIGQYGKIDVRNHSALNQSNLTILLSSLKSGDYIQSESLERTLLRLSDTNGVGAKATLVPGAAPGTSDLIVEVNDAAKTNGQFYTDNYGNRFTGQTRVGFNMNINNLSGNGDMASIGGLLTSGADMNDCTLSYLVPTGGQGAKLGVGYSHMHYLLGGEFAGLNANGIAKTSSIYETFVLNRSRSFNLNGHIGYDRKQLFDRKDAVGYVSDKRAGVWMLGLNGDSRDSFGSGGVNSFALTYSQGHLSMESADAKSEDVTAKTAGSYNKTNLSLYRVQHVTDRLNLHLSFTGQLANKNLDSSEKIYLGGANGVRAYPQGEASGDEGYLMTGEFRWDMPTPSFQLAAFIDNGRVTLNKNPWDTSANTRSLTGAGVGFIWNRASDYSIRLDYAWKISKSLATSDIDKSGRFWLQGVKYF
ncbi:hemolysin activation/secretion protein [Sporomusaceae bacterium BoRhaA]|uniref:ShlB/FhaC/HecB family hemolysin secretion/activation protein n=1 Tax=Pelorhabdus rhamnosifermentans TaxID=2772457 RepID=UPI001C063C9A|nr:ShlB/FhaC/HecB family hemolysin secretion/activation protein [Pelorhabdus rhamnosifermentans]MBU2702176.1 hemolysin activation/secretion protein [Pelorhabdus rhamnosifermentans]